MYYVYIYALRLESNKYIQILEQKVESYLAFFPSIGT